MREGWESVPLGRVAAQYIAPFDVKPNQEYVSLGVKWYAEGVFARPPKFGRDIKGTRLFTVKPGQFIYNRMFATEGSFALVEHQQSNGVVSNEFPAFDLDATRLLPAYLNLHFQQKSVWDYVAQECVGTTKSRSRWKEARFLEYRLALPPLHEQRRIVDLIGSMDEAIEAAEELRCQTEAVFAAMLEITCGRGEDTQLTGRRTSSSIGDVIATIKSGSTIPVNTSGGVPVYGSNGRIGFTDRSNNEAGTIVLGRVGANCGSVAFAGKAFWATDNTLCVTGGPNVDPEYLGNQLRQLNLNQHSSGSGQPLINQSIVRSQQIRLPELANQRNIAGLLSAIEGAVFSSADHATSLRTLRSNLLTVLLSGEHEIPASYDALLEVAA
jgi:type I restriction enzyme S subunit